MAIYKLGEICDYVEGYVNPAINNSKYFNGNAINWIRVKDLKHGQIINETELTLSEEGFNLRKNDKQIFLKNSIVWSKSGTVGNVGILGKNACANRGILNIIPKDKIKKKYLYYFLYKNKNSFIRKATGAVLLHFYGPQLMNEKINLPSLEEQQKIIDIIKPIEEQIKICQNIIDKSKSLLKNNYHFNEKTEKQSLGDYISFQKTDYQNQSKYFATNAIGEFNIDFTKIIDVSKNVPSRAKVSPNEKTLIFSKLQNENKYFYFVNKPNEVFSTGMFCVNSKYIDHVIGFFQTKSWMKQKDIFSNGTTMRGLNNSAIKQIKIKSPILEGDKISSLISKISSKIGILENLKLKIINLLVK
ncbi:MAG: restriction endonuclease subunit S [Mycoplasma sp.]|nr:restriction endonuclease subunit S [Mycoplasma sp.]